MEMHFRDAPTEDGRRQTKRYFARPLWLYREQQDRPDEIKVLFYRERPVMGRIEAAVRIDSKRFVVPEEQQAARQILIIDWNGAEEGEETDPGQSGVVCRQNAKTPLQVEPAQADLTVTGMLFQKQTANQETADREKNVNADIPPGRHLQQDGIAVKKSIPPVVQNDTNHGQCTPAIESGNITVAATHSTLILHASAAQ